MTSPLTPLSANSNKMPPSSRLASPTKTPAANHFSSSFSSPSKLKQTSVVAASSPFTNFSPITASTKSSPMKRSTAAASDNSVFEDEFDPFNDGTGDESVSSNFSDVAYGDVVSEKARPPSSAKRSPVELLPQTPTGRLRSPTKLMSSATPRPAPVAVVDLLLSPTTPVAANQNQTTNFLLDFTQQFDAASRQNERTPTTAHHRTKSASPRKRSPMKTALPPSTPTESRFFNLLDFSPGPAASPGSIPSITPREVEELKAGFNSQISLVKAQLNGREVEVTGLRTAVEETEARCAELSTVIKEQTTRFDDERNGWQKVKAELGELFEAEKSEKESISTILIEKEQVVETLQSELETKTVEVKNLKKRLRDSEDELDRTREEVKRARANSITTPAEVEAKAEAGTAPAAPATADTQAEMERVAHELHTLYKAKHETKVAALKKSYEGRWLKKVTSLQQQIEELTLKNEELAREAEEKKAEELTANMSSTTTRDTATTPTPADEDLRRRLQEIEKELQNERQEKEGIVSLVEELLSIQAAVPLALAMEPAEEKVEKVRRGSIKGSSGLGLTRAGGLRSGIEMMGKGAKRVVKE